MNYISVMELWHQDGGHIWVECKVYASRAEAIKDISEFKAKCEKTCSTDFQGVYPTNFNQELANKLALSYNSEDRPLKNWDIGNWAEMFIDKVKI